MVLGAGQLQKMSGTPLKSAIALGAGACNATHARRIRGESVAIFSQCRHNEAAYRSQASSSTALMV